MKSLLVLLLALALSWQAVACHGQSLTSRESNAIEAAVDAVAPRVVQLRYLGADARGTIAGAGAPISGLLLGAEGWIVTSSYGLVDDPATVLVRTQSGEQRAAELIARDHPRGIVLLKCPPFESLEGDLVESDALVGQRAIAVGRVLGADRVNVSVGVVSAVGRLSGRAVQTDAAASPANYGGPLISLDGRVLGVLTPLSPEGQGGVEWYDSGIGFAAPLSEVQERLPRLKRGEEVLPGKLGVKLAEGAPMWSPPVVEGLVEGGAAVTAGLAVGDTLVSVDGQAVPSVFEFRQRIRAYDAGESVKIEFQREGETQTIEALLAAP